MATDIKFQSLIRKFKNSNKDSNKNIKLVQNTLTDYSYNISINTDINISINIVSLFNSNKKNEYAYSLNLLTEDPSIYQRSTPIEIKNRITNSDRLENSLFDSDTSSSPMSQNCDISIKDYINTKSGYLYNTYNAELCDEEWLIAIFCIIRISNNLTNKAIKSLHINKSPGSTLSAFNHFLCNSTNTAMGNLEWKWVSTMSDIDIVCNNSFRNSRNSQNSRNSHNSRNSQISHNSFNIKDNKTILQQIRKKYGSNVLMLLDNIIYTVNNINFIINNTYEKLGRLNLLVVNMENSTNKGYIMYATLVIKLLETTSMLYIKIPNVTNWDTCFINILLLYTMLFDEVYVYEFYLTSKSTYLICKNRKKINNESIYKKLINIIANPDFSNIHNIFHKSIFTGDIKIWLDKILKIIDDDSREFDENSPISIKFNTILSNIETLNMNMNTFL